MGSGKALKSIVASSDEPCPGAQIKGHSRWEYDIQSLDSLMSLQLPSLNGNTNNDFLKQDSGTQKYRFIYAPFQSSLNYHGIPWATIFLDSLTPHQRQYLKCGSPFQNLSAQHILQTRPHSSDEDKGNWN